MLVDTTQDIIYRDFTLNDADIETSRIPGSGIGSGISGCVIDSIDISDVDVVQFTEKRSEQDGMDAGPPFHGARRIKCSGTLYGRTRALLSDSLIDLRAAMNSRLAYLDEPADKGYQPFYFSVPTNRTDDYPEGAIELRMLAMPRAFQSIVQKDNIGGHGADALAIPWQGTLTCKDPSIMALAPQEYPFTDTVIHTGTAATSDLISSTAHGLVLNDRVYFTVLTGGTGLALNVAYYVISAGLTADAFKVSLTSGGSGVDITVAYSALSFAKQATQAGDFTHRGNYPAPLQMIFVVGSQAGTIAVQAGDSIFTITVPASSGLRTIRFKGADKVITSEEADVESLAYGYLSFSGDSTWPQISPGTTPYTVTFTGLTIDRGATDGSMMWIWEQYA